LVSVRAVPVLPGFTCTNTSKYLVPDHL
jgi:hypothetical protein